MAPHDAGRAPVAPEQITLALSAALTAALSRQARRQGLTLNTFIQAAWAILLGRLTGRDDVVFGVTVAGRPPEIAGIERMVGLFINTLPLRIKLPPGKPLSELLAGGAGRASRGLMAQQHLGLAEIQGLAGLGELFDTLVVFENYPVDRGGLAADAGGLRHHRDQRARCHALSAEPGGHPGRAAAAAARAIGPTCSSGRAWRRWRGGSSGCWRRRLRTPDQPIGTSGHSGRRGAPTHPAGVERHRARDPAAPPCRSCLPRRWRGRPTRSPRSCSRMQSLSYRELDARSSQLAHHLRALGVGPEVVVGLCVERSLEMLIGLLGILKAGGAYLPLDPELSARAARLHARRCARAAAGHALRAARATARAPTPASSASMPTADASPRSPPPPRPAASARKTPPMSSTPQAQPAHQRASVVDHRKWWSRTRCELTSN